MTTRNNGKRRSKKKGFPYCYMDNEDYADICNEEYDPEDDPTIEYDHDM